MQFIKFAITVPAAYHKNFRLSFFYIATANTNVAQDVSCSSGNRTLTKGNTYKRLSCLAILLE